MENRETKELAIGQHKVVVLAYITAREAREIYSSMFDQIDMDNIENRKSLRKKISSKASLELQNKQIETIVISIDGATEDILNKVLDMSVVNFKIIVDHISEVMGEKKNTDGKKLSTSPDA